VVLNLKQKYVIASEKIWNENIHRSLNKNVDCEFILLSNRHDLNIDNLRTINPKIIFFPHWSYLIPEEIYAEFECVVFHMTDLPYGRGGSPLQNLIINGFSDTKITAIRVVKELDAGPVYMKKDLNLSGSANEIFNRLAVLIEKMIEIIILKPCQPRPQTGEPTFFKRRTPDQSNLRSASCGKVIFDMVRMLDADGYPHAYVEIDNFRIEFTNAEDKDGNISSKASFIKINKKG